MQIRPLTPDLAVAPQISADDVAEIASQGFRTLINNRPDGESGDQTPGDDIAAVSEELGLAYSYQPIISGGMTMKDVEDFGRLLERAEKPVLAYCRSGTRCTTLWALSQAGKLDTGEIFSAAAKAGYDLSGLRGQIEALARQRKG